MAKCPKCDKPMASIRASATTIHAPGGQFKGIIYSCPLCQTALNAEIDPLAVRNEIVAGVVEKLKGR